MGPRPAYECVGQTLALGGSVSLPWNRTFAVSSWAMPFRFTRYRSTGVPADVVRTPVAEGWASSVTRAVAVSHFGYGLGSPARSWTLNVNPASGWRALVASWPCTRNLAGTDARWAITSRSHTERPSSALVAQTFGACGPGALSTGSRLRMRTRASTDPQLVPVLITRRPASSRSRRVHAGMSWQASGAPSSQAWNTGRYTTVCSGTFRWVATSKPASLSMPSTSA